MGKGKSSSGKNYTSKGERRSSMSTKNTDQGQRMLNKLRALEKGKDVVMTLPNPDKTQTNQQFVTERISGKSFLSRRQGKS